MTRRGGRLRCAKRHSPETRIREDKDKGGLACRQVTAAYTALPQHSAAGRGKGAEYGWRRGEKTRQRMGSEGMSAMDMDSPISSSVGTSGTTSLSSLVPLPSPILSVLFVVQLYRR